MNPDEITKELLPNLDIKRLALNKEKFGSLTFDAVYPLLERLQKLFTELQELVYQDALSQSEVNQIDQYMDSFVNHLRQLASFDLSVGFNKDQHDTFETNTRNFYDEVFRNLRNNLVYLRQEAELKEEDKKNLKAEQKELLQLRKQSEELVKQLEEERKKIQGEKEQIESVKGERAAVRFGKHFESQAKENQEEVKKWLKWRNFFFWVLLIIISLNVIGYFVLFISNKLYPDNIKPRDFFTIEYGLAKLALLSILSYAIAFSSRNFNVNSNLSTLNKHRKNVAETLNDFLETNPEPQDRSKIVESASEAMFKHQPIGYLPKIESKDDGPVSSIINNILKQG